MKSCKRSLLHSRQLFSKRLHANSLKLQALVYDELPDGKYTRLLTLLPGTKNYMIVCTLTTISLSDLPRCEALSYVWGDGARREGIECSGKRLDITQNLHEAFVHVRSKDQQRSLWVDSICINQKDSLERSKQVLRIRQIYAGARRVLVWLGPRSADDNDAFNIMQWLHDQTPASDLNDE